MQVSALEAARGRLVRAAFALITMIKSRSTAGKTLTFRHDTSWLSKQMTPPPVLVRRRRTHSVTNTGEGGAHGRMRSGMSGEGRAVRGQRWDLAERRGPSRELADPGDLPLAQGEVQRAEIIGERGSV